MVCWLVNLAYVIAATAYLPVLCYQMLVQGKNRRGWRERFGRLRLRPAGGGRRRIWLHAVSLGEVNATPTLIKRLAARFPDHQIVVSSTTDTGYARACRVYGDDRVFRFPLDFSWVVRRVFDRLDPDLIVLVELEVWHNLMWLASRRGIPVAVVNGRLTPRSARRLMRLGSVARSMFGRLAWVGAQDDEIAERFRRLGVPADRVAVVGSLKWDTATVADSVDGADALADVLGLDPSRPLWVCGSTGPGEEEIILDAYRMVCDRGVDVALAIVPRKPERFDDVARLIARRSWACIRRTDRQGARQARPVRSAPAVQGNACPSRTVILGDTMGELRKFYALATVVFVGRSLVPMGGSDPMEAAALGKPLIAGPCMDNFKVPVDVLRACSALTVSATARDLADAVASYCADPSRAADVGRTARQVVLDQQGATAATVDALSRLVPPALATESSADAGRSGGRSAGCQPTVSPAARHRHRH